VKLTATMLELRLEDNGRGFTAVSTDADADGLRNMQQRMIQIGGRFDIQSGPAGGTRVSLVLPRSRLC
jgi:signal transduction histidine kinase